MCFPKKLCSGIVYSFKSNSCNAIYYGKTKRHFYVTSAEHMGISHLTNKRLKNVKQSAISDHLLTCDCNINFDDFTILSKDSNNINLLIKESLLISRDKPILKNGFLFKKIEHFSAVCSKWSSSYSDTGRKIYPKCTRITREDTVTNILNLLDDNNEDALSSSDQESEDENEETSTSSESEYEENESTVSIEEVVHNEVPLEELDNTNNDYENTEVGSKKKRGHPKGSSTANKNQQRGQPDENVDEWNEVVGDNNLRLHEFRFIPAKEPGVQAQLDESSSVLKCFFELFDKEVQTDLDSLSTSLQLTQYNKIILVDEDLNI